MRRLLASFALSLSISVVGTAQQPAANERDAAAVRSMLERAVGSYEAFQVEKALALLDSVLLRRDLLTPAEAARSHKYLGAGHAVMGRKETAANHFFQALKLDGTTDLDPRKFSASEIGPFDVARQRWQSELPADAAVSTRPTNQVGELRLGATRTDALLWIDDVLKGPITTVSFLSVPADRPVRITIRSTKCSVAWDTTVIVRAGSRVTIGRRGPSGCAP